MERFSPSCVVRRGGPSNRLYMLSPRLMSACIPPRAFTTSVTPWLCRYSIDFVGAQAGVAHEGHRAILGDGVELRFNVFQRDGVPFAGILGGGGVAGHGGRASAKKTLLLARSFQRFAEFLGRNGLELAGEDVVGHVGYGVYGVHCGGEGRGIAISALARSSMVGLPNWSMVATASMRALRASPSSHTP